ncbi:MAG: rhizopine catabolism protein [Gammaproteobacteria bacterium]|nr:rhizopine catabolism protein [Gammaproteobacteria bacterium]
MDDFIGRKDLIPAERLRALSERSDRAGALQTASHFGAIAITGVALHQSAGTGWAVPWFVMHGILLNFLFAAQHEYNHYTAFKTRWPNDVFNRITGFIQLYPRDYERWFHFEHHRHTQDWQRDPELIARGRPYTLTAYLLYLFGITYWTGRIKRLWMTALGVTAEYFTPAQRRTIVLEARLHWLAYGAVAAGSLYWETGFALMYWIAPMFVTKVFHNVQNITEHTGLTHVNDTVHNTRTIKTWPLLRWLAWNMQYHTAHHTFPAVPFHKLPELHEELVRRAGYEPPTTSYLAFQWTFIRRLWRGPETYDGIAEIPANRASRSGADCRG